MKTNKYILTLLLAAWCAVGNLYAITSSYYSTVDGKKESGLRDALYSITSVGPANGHSYNNLWTAYKTTDVYPTGDANAGKIWDMYSDCLFTAGTDQCGNYGGVCDCYNREHSLPKSWFSEANPAYYDMGHIVPTDGKVNGMRSNYAFGEVAAGAATWGNGKLGNAKNFTTTDVKGSSSITTTYTGTVFEPADKYKGDFARMYMYMVVRYKPSNSNGVNLAGSGDGQKMFNSTDANYGLTDYSIALLMKWHRQDPVSQKEIDRNNGMQTVQGNRNPFIDYPCLAEYLWGNKAGETVTLSSLVGTFDGSWTTGDGCPCGTDPAITLPNGAIDCGAISANTPVTKTITVKGVNLSANLSLAVSGTNSSFFTLSATTIQKDVAIAGTTVTITYKPTSTGSHTATLTISGGGLASSRTFTLSGTCCNPYTVTLSRNNITETVSACGTYTLPTAEEESGACDYEFKGWLASNTSFTEGTTTAPTAWVTSVTSAKTLHAVYGKTTTTGGGSSSSVSYTFTTSGWNAKIGNTQSNWTSGKAGAGYSNSGVQVTKNGTGANATCPNSYNTITGITVSYCTNSSSGAGTIVMSVGSTEVSQSVTSSGGTSARDLSFDFSSTKPSGSPKITVNCTTNSIYVCGVTITYGGGGTSKTTYKKVPCTVRTISYAHTGGSTTGGTYWADVTSALPGTTITLDYDPAEGYALDNWTVTGGSVTVTNNQFTMPDADVTVSATFKTVPKRTIRFINNGTTISTQEVYEGSTPNVPSVNGCEGYTFVGWWTSALGESNTTEQTWITDFTVTQAQDYYAVFEHTVTSQGGGSTTKSMTSFSAISGNVDSDTNISYEAAKGTAGTAPVVNSSQIRIYQNGGTLTITANNSKKLTSVTIGSAMSTTVTYSVDGGAASSNQSISANGTLTVGDLNATSILFTCKGTTSSTRLYLNSLSVTYSGGGGSTTYYTSTTTCAAACTTLDAPSVTATPGNGQITLTWADVTDATGYTVTIGQGSGYTTECGSAATIGTINHNGSTNTCVITGLTNGLAYTTTVVANASSSTCNSEADSDTATPQECTQWDDPTLSWNKYSLNTSTAKTATITVSGTTHGTLSFESSDTDVLTVNSSGTVTAVGAGEATVTAHWTAANVYCEKTMTSSTFEVTGPLTISFDANGGTGTMSAQTVTYKVSTAISENTFTREGYSFAGWATSADGEKVYNDKQSVAFTNSQTLYAKWQLNSRNVNFTTSITGATVTVNGKSASPQTVEYGATVTVHIAPAEHYIISTVSIKGATSHNDIAQTGSGETRTFTMPDENVTVAVTMAAESQYTATFYNGGLQFGETQTGYADDDITAPATDPEACDESFTFVGWVTVEQTEETTTMPEVLTFPQAMPISNVNFYALYRRVEGSGGGVASVTFKTSSSDQGTAYTDDSGIKTNLVESYTGITSFAGEKAYLGKSGVKLGASGGSGYITLNLSSPITTNTITVHAAKYGTDTGDLQIKVNGSNSFGSALSPADGTLTFTNSSEVEISDLTISTTSKRAYVASISLGGGGTSYYTTSPVCTPCDYHVTLTKGAETNGTFTLSKTNGTYDNCKTNFAVTVSNIVPATGYYCSGVSATGGSHVIVSEPDANGNYTVSFPKGNTVTSTVTAVFEEIPSHTVTWSANGNTTNQVSYKEGATITFPESATGCDGMTFMGWSAVEVEEQDNAPAYTTSATMGTEDITFYAVFATETTTGSGSAGWSQVETLDGIINGTYVIENGGYALPSTTTSSAPVKSNDYKLTISNKKITSTVSAAMQWSFAMSDGHVATITNADGKYLYATSDNNGLRVGNTSDTWTFELNTSAPDFALYDASYSRYCATYGTGSDWRSYTSATASNYANSGKVHLYKYSAGSSTTYSDFTTSCAECTNKVTLVKGTPENGTFNLSPVAGEYNNCTSGGIVVTVSDITPDAGYRFKKITQTGIASGVTISQENKTVTYDKDVAGSSTINVEFELIPTYTVTWSANSATTTEQYKEGDAVTFPATATGCEGKVFRGWSETTVELTNTEPTYISSYTMTAAPKTFYAVFATQSTSGSGYAGWSQVETLDGITDGTYVIENGGYALPSTTTSSAPVKNSDYALTISNKKITSTVSAAMQWSFAMSEGHVATITNAEGKYLYATSDNNGLRVGNTSDTWTFELNTSAPDFALYDASYSRYCATYGTGSDWRSYTSATASNYANSGKVHLYKYSAGSSTTYSDFTTSCAECTNKVTLVKGTPENGTFNLSPVAGEYNNCTSGGFVVTITDITPAEDFEFEAITQTGIDAGVTIDQNEKTVTYAQNVSGTSTINVTYKHKPQYTIKFWEDGKVISEQLVTINKSPVVPDDPEGCDEYEFVGWWTDELADDNTTAQTWVTSFTATEDKNYYAVFRHAETSGGGGASNDFSLYSGALTEGDYLIVYDNGAMNTTVSSDRLQYEVVTPTNDVITTTDATIIWHIAPSGDYWTIYNADAEKYAAGTGAKNKAQMLADGTDNKSMWTVSGTSTYEFVNKANTANSVNANLRKNDTYGYACYATATGGALSLYKNASSGSTTKYYTTDTDCRDCSIPTLSFAATTVNKFDGDAPFINALTVSGNTMGATVSYTSSNPAKAEVSADGTVTINDAMSTEPVTITATLAKADDGVNCQKKVTAAYTLNIYNKVTWLVNGEEYTTGTPTIQTTEGGTIEIAPTNPDGSTICFGKAFVGWTTAEYEEDDAKPETLYTSSSIVGLHITQKTTFYAVFAELTGTLNQYRKGTPTQLTTGQKVIIVNTAANKAMKAVSSFKSGYDVTPVGDAFVTEEQSIIWTVEQVDGGGFYFMYGGNYLNASGSSLYLDGDEDAWTVTGAGPYVITSGKYPTYSLEYYSGEFKSYSTGSGDAFNMDLYFPNWTIGAYATTCGLCMPKPEVTSTIIKSDRVTITWKAVVNAAGYEFTCSGGEVSVSGTTATITGLTPLSDYTYSIRAQGGAPYTCFRTTNGSFSTPDCDDMPYDITATPYNVVQAIIRWKAEAERGKVVVYNDEACTQTRVTIADTISPCYVSGLEENTRYWFKVFGGVSQDCESPVQTFLTQTTAVEIVEWQNNGVIILLTGDETTASVLIEDKQEHIENAGNVADKLFISKYFEADGNNKMIAVYNGTKETIDITNYWLKHSNKGSAETKICLKKFGKTPGQIAPNEEIIIMRFTSSTDPATECAEKEENYDEWNIVEDKEMDGEGNNIYNWLANIAGPQSVGLYNGTTMIDLIGARTESGALVQIQSSIKEPCSDAIGAKNDAGGFSARGLERGSGDSITLSTNRCLLIRKNTVKSGDNAVATNIYSSQEECSSEITKAFKTLSDEWVGYVIGKDNASTRTCEGLAEVGGFDYQGYYASYDTAVVVQDLVQNADGTITIPIPKLDTMSCTMLRINVYDKNTKEQKASREYRIPIMIQSGEVKSTNELFTKHGVAVCKDCDVLVFNGATLKKDNVGEDRDTIGNLTLYPGSTLELPSGKGDYHVKSLTYRVEGDNVPATKLNGDLYSETQQLIVTRRINNDRYYFISFPYDVNVNEITLANGNKAVNGKDFRLLEYDAEARATEGSLQGAPGHWKLFSGDKLTAGQGYAIAVNTKAMKEIMFPMTIPSKNLTNEERTKVTNTVDINEYVGAARNTNHNWNLIAHPYITKFEVSGAESVEAYWENPSRQDSAWVDDWTTWPEEDPTQPTDTTHTQNPDSTETHIGDILESGTVDNGLVWVLYANATMELTGGGQMVDFSSLEAVPWAQHRQFIKDLKIGGDVQKIGKYAFSQCTNLVTVTIAAPVTNLASYAFAGCTQVRNFRIESTQYISATTTTFDGVSTLSVYVPQSMYDQYRQNSPWNKMALSAFDGSSTTGGDGSNTNPTPRRVAEHPEGWTESAGGIYVTVPTVVDGKVDYEQHWINDVDDIKPFTAVFIQGDGKGQMTFNMYPATPAPKRMWQADRYETRDHTVFVGLTINGNGHKDMTSLRLRPDFTEEYKLNLDLLKFTTFYTSRPQIYFKTEKDQLAFRAVSDSLAANTWLPVGVYCRDAGEYTFALHDRYVWDEVEAVYLRDNVTGAETNLLMGNYTITTTGQIYTNTRFAVKVLLRRKVKDTPTMIDHTEDPNAPRKFFRDGLLYIMRDGKVYDLTGKPVQFDDLLNR